MSPKQVALDLAPTVIDPTGKDSKGPRQVHLRSARFHRPASQDRLVDQPHVERR